MKMRFRAIGVFAFWLAIFPCLALGATANPFPEPASMRPAVEFWKRVYLDVTSKGGFIHDDWYLDVVYETVHFDTTKNRRARQKLVDKRKKYWAGVLQGLARAPDSRSTAARLARAKFQKALGRAPLPQDYRGAAKRLRFQYGQRDRFHAGLIRAGAYEDRIRTVLRKHGVPEDLAYLPHVESSFNTHAYSKHGAAGMWQFIPSTGRLFMQVNYAVDERLDPHRATEAAAKLLRNNYNTLGTWPLAITAYNHGRLGMQRAVKAVGTRDIATIVEKYNGRAFRFASRNFYAQFLAARKIARSAESHFGKLKRDAPQKADALRLPFYADIRDLGRHLKVEPKAIAELNPMLRPPVLSSEKRIPSGVTLKLPAGTLGKSAKLALASYPKRLRYSGQPPSQTHRVRRGETLSQIAHRHGTSVASIVALNNLRNRHRIYAGQVLELQTKKASPSRAKPIQTAAATRLVKVSSKPAPAPVRQAPKAVPKPATTVAASWRRIDNGRITVDVGETLGHIADWLRVSTRRLRELNNLSLRRPIRFGQRLKLDFSRTSPKDFLAQRVNYHEAIEKDFYRTYAVTGTVDHTLQRGENLWALAKKVYELPTWLLRRYNPETDFKRLMPGTRLTIPVVEERPIPS